MGPKAQEKKKMVKGGQLDKFGKKIEGVTPQNWSQSYVDYNEVEGQGQEGLVSTQPPAAAPAVEKMEVDGEDKKRKREEVAVPAQEEESADKKVTQPKSHLPIQR